MESTKLSGLHLFILLFKEYLHSSGIAIAFGNGYFLQRRNSFFILREPTTLELFFFFYCKKGIRNETSHN